MVTIPNYDGHIWDADLKAVEIISELVRNGEVTISTNNEGGDNSELGLYRLLDCICDQLNISKSKITILTRNQLESHNEYNIVKEGLYYQHYGKIFAMQNKLPVKNFDDIKHFGIFIGRSNWQRLWMAAHIYQKKEIATLSFHYDGTSDYHKSHLGFEELSHRIGSANAIELTSDLLTHTPICIDAVDSYPILQPAHYAISKIYHTFFLDVVCETYSMGKTFFATEKTWRPIVCLTPFILQGPTNYLSNLKKLGFETFSKYWDEGYDQHDGMTRLHGMKNIIDQLSKKSTQDLELMYNDMMPILEHNKSVLLHLTDEKLKALHNE